MKAPPITVRPWAEFRSSLPTDTIEDEHDIIQVGGKTVGEEIGKILVRLGCRVDDPVYEGDHGWGFSVYAQDRRLNCQITDVGYFLFMIKDSSTLGWIRKRPNLVYFDVLTRLAEELERDPRFWDIVWHSQEDAMSNMPGAARPVGDQPPIPTPFWSEPRRMRP